MYDPEIFKGKVKIESKIKASFSYKLKEIPMPDLLIIKG